MVKLLCAIKVDESLVEDDEERNARSDDVEYVRTAVVCDAQDQYMQQVSIPCSFFILESSIL